MSAYGRTADIARALAEELEGLGYGPLRMVTIELTEPRPDTPSFPRGRIRAFLESGDELLDLYFPVHRPADRSGPR